MKKLLLASCLAVAGLFALSGSDALAQGRHHGHGHHGHGHHGHGHHGHYGHHGHHGHWNHGGHWHGGHVHYYSPPVVYRQYPVYRTYGYYPYAYPSSSLFIGGRNFSFGISGF